MTYYKLYFIVFIFFCLFLEIESFTPAGRFAHSSVLVENKNNLYFFGGETGKFEGPCTNEVFSLDVARSFNAEVPPWNDLTSKAGIPFRSCWGTVSLINNQTVYLFG